MNGTTVAQGSYYDGAYYTFQVENTCKIKVIATNYGKYLAYSAEITM